LRLNLFWLAVACCAVAQIALLHSALKAGAPSDTALPAPSRWSEVVWTLIPAVGLALVLAFTWRTIEAHSRSDVVRPAATSATIIERAS